MTQCILQINKKAQRAGDHIAFAAAETLDPPIDIGGGMCYHRYIEHYEKLASEEERKIGLTNILSTEETENEIFYTVDESQVPLIKEVAVSITNEFPESYERQYTEFIQRLQNEKIIA
ncbi:hypothetical protein L2D08_07315 [Domibacillus sp. PGB-M46]|uniref:hypothetical protein n=1 Tax=Domibacillus sp. PGB-M46 TaxID=2910255 RepID=UPI001F582A5A|nr:hypothetical protein [Domibacillus sp. PGB-M46]MCI2254170.1 hypothetical protein [Domibacillus sp. PGB-M46]